MEEFTQEELLSVTTDPDSDEDRETNGIRENDNSEETLGSSANKGARSKPYRYKDCDDINILMEVLMEKPGGKDAARKWKKIQERLGNPRITYISIKRRFQTLLKAFKDENMKSLRGSGLEESYNGKVRLLTEIASEIGDWESLESDAEPSAKKKQAEQQKKAQRIREASLSNLRSDIDVSEEGISTPKRAKYSQREIFDLIKASEERDRQQKELSMEYERKRLDLAERELKLKEENDKHRRAMERERVDLDRRKIEIEERKLELEKNRAEKELEERSVVLSLAQKKL